VYLASYTNESADDELVAVKLVKVNANLSEMEDFLAEAELMVALKAPTLLKVDCTCKINNCAAIIEYMRRYLGCAYRVNRGCW
jgi:hypothetical protein